MRWLLLLVLVVCAVTAGKSPAAEVVWQGDSDSDPLNWLDPENWSSNAVPGPQDSAQVLAGTAEIKSPAGSIFTLSVNGSGVVKMAAAGQLTSTQLRIGNESGSHGEFQIESGEVALSQQETFVIGSRGIGIVRQNGGQIGFTSSSSGAFRLGDRLGEGTYHLSDGELRQHFQVPNSGDNYIGISGGTGEFNQSGGIASFRGRTLVGYIEVYDPGCNCFVKGHGTVNQSAGVFEVLGSELVLGDVRGVGTFNISGGELRVPSGPGESPLIPPLIRIGHWTGGNGTLNATGGRINAAGMHVGVYDATGHLNISGDAEVNIADSLLVGAGVLDRTVRGVGHAKQAGGRVEVGGRFAIGVYGTSSGEYLLQDGELHVVERSFIAMNDEAPSGSGELIVTGGVANLGGGLTIGASPVGVGEYHQSGGNVHLGGDLELGRSVDSAGHATLTDGTIVIDGDVHIGIAGQSSFSMTGGHISLTGNLFLAEESTSSSSFRLEGGVFEMAGGDISSGEGNASFEFAGGELRSPGVVNDSLTNSGGNLFPEATRIIGDYSSDNDLAILTISIRGTMPGTDYSQLVVVRHATLGGTLKVELPPVNALAGDANGDGSVDISDLNAVRNSFGTSGPSIEGDTNDDGVVDVLDLNNVRNAFDESEIRYMPRIGDAFEILRAELGVSGIFDSIDLPEVPDGSAWFVDYQPSSVQLRVVGTAIVPESSTINLVSVLIVALLASRFHCSCYSMSGRRTFFQRCLVSSFALFLSASYAMAAPIELPTGEEEGAQHPAEIRAAIELFEQGDATGAFDQLKASAADYPHLPPPRIMLANLYFSSGNYEAGRLSLEQAAVEHPGDPETYLILGDLLIRERRWTEADALYERGEAFWSKFQGDAQRRTELEGRLRAGQAAVAEARGQWDAAAKLLTRYVELAPKKSSAHQRLGRVQFMLKHEKEAFAEFQHAETLNRNQPPASIMMAMLFLQQGKQPKGEEWIKYALEKSPKDYRTQLGAAQFNWDVGRLDAAATYAGAALKLKPDALDAQLLAAQAAYFQGKLPEAEQQLEAAREATPGNFTVVNLLAWALAASEDAAKLQRGVELAGLNAQRFPDNAEAAATLAWALFRSDKKTESHASLRRIRANASLSRDAAYFAARILHDAGESTQAMALLDGALNNSGPFAAEAEARAWRATLTSAKSPGS